MGLFQRPGGRRHVDVGQGVVRFIVVWKRLSVGVQSIPKDVWRSLSLVGINAVFGRGLAFLRSVVYACVVKPEQLGLYSLAFGTVSLMMPFVIGGSTSLLVRYASYEGFTWKKLFLLALRWPLVVGGMVCLFLTAGHRLASTLIFGQPDYFALSILTAVVLISFVAFSLVTATFQGRQRFDASVTTEIINSAVSLLAGTALALTVQPVAESLMLGSVAGFAAALAFSSFAAPKVLGGRSAGRTGEKLLAKDTPSQLPVQEAKRFSHWMTWAAIAYIFVNWGLLNRWVLGRQVSMSDAGRMYAVLTLCWTPFLLFQLVGTVMQPRLSEMTHQGRATEVRSLANTIMQWGMPVGLGVCLVTLASVRLFLIDILGADYDAPLAVIGFLALSCYFHIVLYFNSVLAIAEGRARTVFISNMVSAVTNAVLCLLLVNTWGTHGVTFALAVAFFAGVVMISALNYLRKVRFFRGYWALIVFPGMLIAFLVRLAWGAL